MDKADCYKYYQANIELLNVQITQVEKIVRTAVGKKEWQVRKSVDAYQIARTEKEIKASTRLLTFLICSWLEARLMKILHENSSVAFSAEEIERIEKLKTMDEKWKNSFLIAVCKSYGFHYVKNADYTCQFEDGSIEKDNYKKICDFFDDIEDAITIRNRLAHGQWDVQFNSKKTSVKAYGFLGKYDNIQKLIILKQCYESIAEIISAYITYKDKKNPRFNHLIEDKIKLISDKKVKIMNMDYSKYVSKLERKYESVRKQKAEIYQ